MPPLILSPCTIGTLDSSLGVALLPPACRRLFAFFSRLRPPCREWFDLLRLQWHTKGGRMGSCVPCLTLGRTQARDMMPDLVTLLITLTIKCLPARRLFSCIHPSLWSHSWGHSAVDYRSALKTGLGWLIANPLVTQAPAVSVILVGIIFPGPGPAPIELGLPSSLASCPSRICRPQTKPLWTNG